MPDFSALTFSQVMIAALALAVADTVWNIVMALAKGNFSAAVVATFLESHVLMRIVPIGLLASLGAGVFFPAVPIFFQGAIAALTAYAVETVGSMYVAAQQTKNAPPAPGA